MGTLARKNSGAAFFNSNISKMTKKLAKKFQKLILEKHMGRWFSVEKSSFFQDVSVLRLSCENCKAWFVDRRFPKVTLFHVIFLIISRWSPFNVNLFCTPSWITSSCPLTRIHSVKNVNLGEFLLCLKHKDLHFQFICCLFLTYLCIKKGSHLQLLLTER